MDFVWIPIRKHIVCTDFCKAVPKGRYDREKQGSQSGSRKCLYVWRLLVRCIDADLRYFKGIFPGISVHAVCTGHKSGYAFDCICYGSPCCGTCISSLLQRKGRKGNCSYLWMPVGAFPVFRALCNIGGLLYLLFVSFFNYILILHQALIGL